MRYLMTLILLGGAALSAGAGGELPAAQDKPEITEISSIPWVPPFPGPRPKVVYGEDDRIDLFQETDTEKRTWAYSTCALIDTSRLTQNTDGTWTISAPGAYYRAGLPPCEGEPFGGQPTASYCTGFMVGSDLIVTAGHCYNSYDLASTRFIFGFYMVNETTPRLSFQADEVYRGIEIVSAMPTGSSDHCVVRVDRPITAPGARPFKLRREGTIQPGDYVGVIGHPSGLPLKLAFGNTYVRSSTDPGFFVANLDTYGGNSGSPVINAATGVLEGILVRGDTDFIYQSTCFISNVVPSDGGRGEDVTKATVFAASVPDVESSTGVVSLDNGYYGCGSEIMITLIDADLSGMGLAAVVVESSGGDTESVALAEDANQPGRFTGVITTTPGTAVPGSSVLEAGHGDVVAVIYTDEEDENGDPAVAEATALMDCYSPVIGGVTVSFLGTTQAQIQFTTDEPAQGILRYGSSCGNLTLQASGATTTAHSISLNGLSPNTRYYFAVEARDPAGNAGVNDNSGACFDFMTYNEQNYFTEYFNTLNLVDIQYSQATFLPVDDPNRYQACKSAVSGLPVPASGEAVFLEDDGYQEVPLPAGTTFNFYGLDYDRFFIGSNGYITFGTGDASYQALPSQHFLLPRISAMMCDLNPSLRGAVYVARLSDRYAVTFVGVPVYDGTGLYPPENSHTFQIELFFSGIIRVTWLEIAATRIIAGLSAGIGTPTVFTSVKISHFSDCGDVPHDGDCHSADINQDWRISLDELLRVIQIFHSDGYSCNASTEDGYQPGDGPRDCTPHDSDYNARDWDVSLSELLRLIQFYNAAGYRSEPGSEDGFQTLP